MLTTSTVNVCIEYYLPTDARHWRPSGVASVDLEIDSEIADYGDENEWIEAINDAAEAWCDRYHGSGSFSRVLPEV